MIYLICGTDQEFSLNKEVKKNLKNELGEQNEFNVTKFDLNLTSIEAILDECSNAPIFEDKKGVVVNNASIFTSSFKDEKKIDLLQRFFKNFPDYLCLIFVYPGHVDEKNPIFKIVNTIGRIVSIEDIKENDWPIVIGQLLNKFEIDITDDAKNEFINRTSGDVNRVIREVSKLKTYGGSITFETVCNLIDKPLEENMFGMVDAILNGDCESALKIYNDLVFQGQELVPLVSALATQFRFLYQVKYLHENGLNNNEIADQFKNVKSGRVYYALKKVGTATAEQILKVLSDLSDLDNDIRLDYKNSYQKFELFLIKQH